MSQAAALPDVIRDIERVDPATVAQAAAYPSSILADVAGRRGACSGRIAPLARRCASPARPSPWKCAPATT
jgi:4-hydroxy-4-methyl-2-oxoglutarate aldolase